MNLVFQLIKYPVKSYLLYFLWLFSLPVFAQEDPLYFKYSDENGLPDSETYELLQDRKGFIWIATARGLVRFDGLHFKHYHAKQQISNALTGIYEDKQGKIWVNDFTGRVFFVERDTLRLFNAWNPKNSFSFPHLEVNKNGLWVVSYEGIYLFLDKRKKNHRFWNINNYRAISCTENEAFVALPHRILHIRAQLDTVSYPIAALNYHSEILVYPLENKKYVLLTNTGGIYEFLPNNKVDLTQSIKVDAFVYRHKIIGEKLYACSEKGLWIFGLKNNLWQLEKHFFRGMRISNIIQDHEGNLWMTTLNNGVLQVPSLQTTNTTLPDREILMKVAVSENGILMGTEKGKIYLNKQLIYADTNQKSISTLAFSADKKSALIGAKYLLRVPLQSSDEAKKQPQSFIINNAFKQWKQFDYQNKSIHLLCSSSGIYVATPDVYAKAFTYLPKYLSRKIENPQYNLFANAMNWSLLSTRASAFLHNEKEEIIFVITKDGLVKIDNQETVLLTDKGEAIYATCINQVKDLYWVGTATNGLWLIDKSGKVLKKINRKDGLLGNSIYKISAGKNFVWIATDNGLQQLNFDAQPISALSIQNGLASNKINDLAVFNDTVYVASSRGLLRFVEDFSNQSQAKPRLYLLRLQYQNPQDTSPKITHEISTISLQYAYKRLVIELGMITFNDRTLKSFQYRIKGLQKSNWSKNKSTENSLDLTALPAGNYTFEAFVLDKNGNPIGEALQIPIQIAYPFWQTIWFWSIIFVLVFVLIYGFLSLRIRNIKERDKLLIEKEKLQKDLQSSLLASIKAQMNPHFIFNALNTIQYFIFNNDKVKANHFLSKFSQLMRKILQMSNVESISLAEEIESLRLYLTLEQMRFQEALHWQINVNDTLDAEEIYIPSMLIQPYIENALKHGLLHKEEKYLTIDFLSEKENCLQILIEDNGIGRKKAEEIKQRKNDAHISYSSSANAKRLDILNQHRANKIALQIVDLHDEEGEASGTKVILHIPYHTS